MKLVTHAYLCQLNQILSLQESIFDETWKILTSVRPMGTAFNVEFNDPLLHQRPKDLTLTYIKNGMSCVGGIHLPVHSGAAGGLCLQIVKAVERYV